ncbi:hypothetical protein ACHAW6_001186, partial [Cyclotella cf. meneghiniana]
MHVHLHPTKVCLAVANPGTARTTWLTNRATQWIMRKKQLTKGQERNLTLLPELSKEGHHSSLKWPNACSFGTMNSTKVSMILHVAMERKHISINGSVY